MILNVTYHLPADEVRGLVKLDEGGPAVTVEPANRAFELVADGHYITGHNYQGKGVPLVRYVNTHPSSKFEAFSFVDGLTVCRTEQSSFRCGLRIEDGNVPWFVLFDHSQVPNSTTIRSQAAGLIAKYRQ